MFEKNGKQTKRNLVSDFTRLLHRQESGFDGSQCSHLNDDESTKAFNSQAYLFSKHRVNEVETEKAYATALSRHERWKGGGPI